MKKKSYIGTPWKSFESTSTVQVQMRAKSYSGITSKSYGVTTNASRDNAETR